MAATPEGRSSFSFASFEDPDRESSGCSRKSRRGFRPIDSATTTFNSASDLATALRSARPRTVSMRNAPAKEMRTGPIGTPNTWSSSTPAQSCRNERHGRSLSHFLIPQPRSAKISVWICFPFTVTSPSRRVRYFSFAFASVAPLTMTRASYSGVFVSSSRRQARFTPSPMTV